MQEVCRQFCDPQHKTDAADSQLLQRGNVQVQ